MRRFCAIVLMLGCGAGCAHDVVLGDDDAGDDTGDDASGPDADTGDGPCDMTGIWIAEQHTVSIALSQDQNTTNWYYYAIADDGDRFTVTDSLNCGFVVDGTTTVSLGDETLAALAEQEIAGPNRGGTYKESGSECEFSFDRMYNLRGADKVAYLTGTWNVGDPPKPLSEFPAMPTQPPGMQDWDGDNMDGITLVSGLGERYVAQRDWNEHAGTVPQYSAMFGGPDVVVVHWDSQEGISTQTPPLLRTTATPSGDGWARYARADGQLTVTTPLETCRAVQQLAGQFWP
jgi:hypothetical protein